MKYIDTIVDNLHVYIYIKIDKKGKEKIMKLSLIYYQRLYCNFFFFRNWNPLINGIEIHRSTYMKNKERWKIYYEEKRTNFVIMHDKQIYWVVLYIFSFYIRHGSRTMISLELSVGLVSNDMLSASSTLIGHVKISHLAYQ